MCIYINNSTWEFIGLHQNYIIWSSQHPWGEYIIIIPILQMIKRLRVIITDNFLRSYDSKDHNLKKNH